ncbi:hypothetical protein CUN85_03940 [Methanolobus halotolerans]|uniref:Zincin peptidase n=1 Tax=Methanolobus halotolerans TaxID=2052935 RepID=A0A4E0Q1A6_9EURY|nr:hypothetical protein CUN85_03940 [Methanolobus halotolerans]
MKLSSKIPVVDPQRHNSLIEDNWVHLKEPQNLVTAIAASLPLMALNLLLTIGVISLFPPLTPDDLGISQGGFQITINLWLIAGFIGFLVMHELLHLVLIPDFTSSARTYIGITHMGGFVYSEEMIRKSAYLLITIAPFVALSILLPAMLGSMGLLSPALKILILLNSMASSMDVLTFILVLTQVPDSSYITSNGMRTYWKK